MFDSLIAAGKTSGSRVQSPLAENFLIMLNASEQVLFPQVRILSSHGDRQQPLWLPCPGRHVSIATFFLVRGAFLSSGTLFDSLHTPTE